MISPHASAPECHQNRHAITFGLVDTAELVQARNDFRDQALTFWALLRQADSAAANENTDAADALIAQWATDGVLLRVVRPLLLDAEPAVRYAAAVALLNQGLDDECERVLRELQTDPKGLIAPTARLLLMTRKRRAGESGA